MERVYCSWVEEFLRCETCRGAVVRHSTVGRYDCLTCGFEDMLRSELTVECLFTEEELQELISTLSQTPTSQVKDDIRRKVGDALGHFPRKD